MKLSTLRIAWRNLGRNRRRTGLALAAIAIGQLGYLMMCGIYHGASDSIVDTITGPMSGHVQMHAADWREERAVDLVVDDLDETLRDVRSTEGVARAAGRIYSPVLAALGETGFQAMVVGVDPGEETDDRGILRDLPDELWPGDRGVLVGYLLARKLEVKGGEEIAIVGLGADGSMANGLYTVRSIIRTPIDSINRLGIVLSMSDAQQLFVMPNQAHEIVVHAATAGTSDELAARIAAQEGEGPTEVVSWRQAAPQIASYIDLTDNAGAIMLVLVLIASAVGVANTMMMSTFERSHEFGMLLSLGCRPRKVVWMIVVEAIVLGVVGVAVGTALGAGIVSIIGHTGFDMGLNNPTGDSIAMFDMQFPTLIYPRLKPGDAINGTLAVSITAILAALWPASFAARLEPSEAMRA